MKKNTTKKHISVTTKILVIIGVIVAIFALAFGVHYLDRNYDKTTPPLKDKMGMTIYGELVCLPHKGDGPHTMECATGLKDDEGNHFALIDIRPQGMPETGKKVRLDGVFVPINPDDENQKYDIVGSIRYARVKEIKE